MRNRVLYITYMGLTEPLLYSQVLGYLKGLSKKGILVYILSFEKKKYLIDKDIAAIREGLDREGIRWFFLNYHKRFQFLSKPYDVIRGISAAFYISFKERIGVVHARGTFCALMGVLPCLFLRSKMIFDIRGFMAEEYVDAGLWDKKSVFYKITSVLERYLMKKANEVVVLTESARDLLAKVRLSDKKITVIPTCVDLERFNLNKEINDKIKTKYMLDGKSILIYTGSLGSWYMLPEMIDFYKELQNLEHNTVFFILSQTEKDWIKQHIPGKLKKGVIVDFVEPKNVARLISLANTGIFFIKPCFSKTVSCPTKFGEYLACGLPVVINKGIGDTEEIVKDNKVGVVVESFTAAEYRKAIGRLRELLRDRDDLRKRCRSAAEKYFSLKEGVDKYNSIYKRL